MYISPAHRKIGYNCLVFLSIANDSFFFAQKFLFYFHANFVIGLSMFTSFYCCFYGWGFCILLLHPSTFHAVHTIPQLIFLLCHLFRSGSRSYFGSFWNYLRARDNLPVFSTALKSDNQPLTMQNLPFYPKSRQDLIQTNNVSI